MMSLTCLLTFWSYARKTNVQQHIKKKKKKTPTGLEINSLQPCCWGQKNWLLVEVSFRSDKSGRHFFLRRKWSHAKRGRLTGMKLNLGFSCGWWPALTAVPTAPLNPIKHACSCFPVFLPFFFFFFLQKGAIDIRRKIHGGGGRAEERQGCRVSRAQCEQLRGVISQAGSPLSGLWLGRTGGAGEARASKGHQQVGGRFGGGHSWRDRKGPVCKACHNPPARNGGRWLMAGEQRRIGCQGLLEWLKGSRSLRGGNNGRSGES